MTSFDVDKKRKKPKFRIGWIIISALLILASAVLLWARGSVPGFANFYAGNIYPLWQASLGRLAGIFPFSLSELLLYAALLLVLLDLITSIISKSRKKRLFGFFRRIIVFASALFFLFSANCGVNYYRAPFIYIEKIPIIPINEIDEKLLVDFCKYAADGIELTTREAIAQDLSTDAEYFDAEGNLIASNYYPKGAELGELAISAMQRLGKVYPSVSGYYPTPKPITNSRPFSNMGVTGIYSPFTIEANYNSEMTEYNLPFTACHELSHLKGYMDEGEANFIGWLACLHSDNSAFNRSAYFMAWIYAGNQLYIQNPDLFYEMRASLPLDARNEFQANNEFWDKYETKASEIQNQINDAYLQANGLQEGILSYDAVLIMMLSWYVNSLVM